MAAKSVKRTIERVIKKIESGDYDPQIIEHMLFSLIESRDRRIRFLEAKAKPREFVLTQKRISGALRNTIKHHGPIYPENINSAAKRIYGTCLQIIEENKSEL